MFYARSRSLIFTYLHSPRLASSVRATRGKNLTLVATTPNPPLPRRAVTGADHRHNPCRPWGWQCPPINVGTMESSCWARRHASCPLSFAPAGRGAWRHVPASAQLEGGAHLLGASSSVAASPPPTGANPPPWGPGMGQCGCLQGRSGASHGGGVWCSAHRCLA
jgi:hypothetical protein